MIVLEQEGSFASRDHHPPRASSVDRLSTPIGNQFEHDIVFAR